MVPTPKGKGVLLAVSAVSQSEAWAVGARGDRALIERWDGTRWRVIPSPNVGESVLNDIAAASSKDVWAVGNRAPWETFGSSGPPLIEHWDGRQWRVVASAHQQAELELVSVSVAQGGEVWAVGDTPYLRGNRCVEHSRGGRWQIVLLPSADNCTVTSVGALTPRDVWIVSSDRSILRWDGKHWHATPRLGESREIPGCPHCSGLGVSGLAAISDRDAWVAGDCCDSAHGLSGVYFAHWNGARWQRVHAPFDRPFEDPSAGISDISAVSARDVWAVGYRNGSALGEHYSCSG